MRCPADFTAVCILFVFCCVFPVLPSRPHSSAKHTMGKGKKKKGAAGASSGAGRGSSDQKALRSAVEAAVNAAVNIQVCGCVFVCLSCFVLTFESPLRSTATDSSTAVGVGNHCCCDICTNDVAMTPSRNTTAVILYFASVLKDEIVEVRHHSSAGKCWAITNNAITTFRVECYSNCTALCVR